jgi:hypothetical protein
MTQTNVNAVRIHMAMMADGPSPPNAILSFSLAAKIKVKGDDKELS